MKIIEHNSNILVMRDKDTFTKLWGILMPVFSSVAFYVVMKQYTPALRPAVIMCIVFFVVGIFVLFFINKNLTYEFYKLNNLAKISYPVRFATTFEIEKFKLSDIKCLEIKWGLSYGDTTEKGSHGPRTMKGFDFILSDGKKIHSGIYSTSSKDIDNILKQVSEFLNLEILEGNKTDILLN